MLLFLMRQNN